MSKVKKLPARKSDPATVTIRLTPVMQRQAKALFDVCGLNAEDIARCALEDHLDQFGQPLLDGRGTELDFLINIQARTLIHLRKGGAK